MKYGYTKTQLGCKAKMKKMILFLMMMIVLTSYAHAAHFVCGKVNDAADGTTASWRLAYISMTNRSDKTDCEVNPTEKKYCCDLEDLAKTWAIGNNIYAWIPDDGSGYFADEVSSVATGAGYDVMPEMDLIGIITIIGINSLYTVDHASGTISTLSPYTSEIGYSLNGGSRVVLCSSCSSTAISLTGLANDDYTLTAYAKDNLGNERTKSVLFTVSVPPPTTTTTTLGTGAGAGGGGASIGPRPTAYTGCKSSFTSILMGKPYIFYTDDCYPLVSVEFVTSKDILNANVNANVIQSDNSSDVEGFNLYSKISVFSDMKEGDVAKVIYKIKIDKLWLESRDAEKDQIAVINDNDQGLKIIEITDSNDYYLVSLLSNSIQNIRVGAFDKGIIPNGERYTDLNMTAKPRIKQPAPGKIPGDELIRRAVMKQFYQELTLFFIVVAIVIILTIIGSMYSGKKVKEHNIKKNYRDELYDTADRIATKAMAKRKKTKHKAKLKKKVRR